MKPCPYCQTEMKTFDNYYTGPDGGYVREDEPLGYECLNCGYQEGECDGKD